MTGPSNASGLREQHEKLGEVVALGLGWEVRLEKATVDEMFGVTALAWGNTKASARF